MQIKNALLNNLKVNTDLGMVAPAKTAEKKESFENYMSDTASKQKTSSANEKKITNEKKTEKPDRSKSSVKKTSKEDKRDSKKTQDKKTEENADVVLKSLSEELNIPQEVIADILSELNITVFDLADNENLSQFMQEVFDVASPVELLSIPDIREIMGDVRDILDGISLPEEVEAKTAVNVETVKNEMSIQSDLVSSPEQQLTSINDAAQTLTPVESETAATDETSEAVNTAEQNAQVEMPVQVNIGDSEAQSFNSDMGNHQEPTINLNSQAMRSVNTLETAEVKAFTAQGNIRAQDVIKQITENLKTNISAGVTEIKVVLKPEQLGDITLKVLTENGIITAKFIAENERVKEIIESNFNDLKDTLQQQGINVSELSVSVGQDDTSERMQHFLREQQKSGARIRQIINNISADFSDGAVQETQAILPDSSINYMA